MGWLSDHEQQDVLLRYGRRAELRCNSCSKPIFVEQLFSVDPKGGFFKKPADVPSWVAHRPKVTYHYSAECDPVLERRQGKRAAQKKVEPVDENEITGKVKRVAKAILELLTTKKKKQYWMKTVVVKSLKKEYKAALIRKALRAMIAQGMLRKNGLYLSPSKKKGKGVR